MSTTTAAVEPRTPVDNSVGWLLAFAPALILLLDAALLLSGYLEAYRYGIWAAVAVNVVLAVADCALLRSRGYETSWPLAVLIVPAYLFHRSRVTRQTYALPCVWLAVFLASVVGSLVLDRQLGVVEMDMRLVESSIKEDVDGSLGTDALVGCPRESLWQVGDTFECVVEDATGVATMGVVIEDIDGYFSWRLTSSAPAATPYDDDPAAQEPLAPVVPDQAPAAPPPVELDEPDPLGEPVGECERAWDDLLAEIASNPRGDVGPLVLPSGYMSAGDNGWVVGGFLSSADGSGEVDGAFGSWFVSYDNASIWAYTDAALGLTDWVQTGDGTETPRVRAVRECAESNAG